MLVLVLTAGAAFSAPPALWNQPGTDTAAIDAAWTSQPPAVRPALDFEKVLIRIRAGAPVAEWKAEMAKFATATGTDGVITALREAAKVWLARVAMKDIDGALRKYYREQVCFPDSFAEVQRDLPADAKQDPWGEPWIYKPAAPRGFAKLAKQRYQLAPPRYPSLTPLDEAVKTKQAAIEWKLTPRDIAGTKALELRGADGKAAMLQPGGRAGDVSLVFIGEGWALLADTERLFTVSF